MGPENSGGPVVAYLDGRPVEIGQPLPEITPDYSAGGVSAADAAEAMATVSKAWADVSITMEVAEEGLRAFMYSLELGMAVHLARIFEPDLARRYIHTKKKRTRRKYEKRIMAWFREVLG